MIVRGDVFYNMSIFKYGHNFAEYHNLRSMQFTLNNIIDGQINSVNKNFLELPEKRYTSAA